MNGRRWAKCVWAANNIHAVSLASLNFETPHGNAHTSEKNPQKFCPLAPRDCNYKKGRDHKPGYFGFVREAQRMSEQPSRELIILDQASRMLAEAKSLEEVKAIRDKAEAARTYARAARLGLELQNRAAEIKLRAERKAGLFLAKLALHGGDRRSRSHDVILKLQDIGITASQSYRWQQEAAIPERDFGQFLKSAQDSGHELTAAGLLRFARSLRQPRADPDSARPMVTPQLLQLNHASEEPSPSELLEELRNHLHLLAQLLQPLCDVGRTDFTTGQRRMVARLLKEMQEFVAQLQDQLSDRSPSNAV